MLTSTDKPIYDVEVEQAILYCLLHFPATREHLKDIGINDFYNKPHQDIFAHIRDNPELDVKVIPERIKADKHYIHALTATSLESSFDKYLTALKRYSARRKLKEIGHNIEVKAVEDREPLSVIDWAKGNLEKIDTGKRGLISTQQSEIDEQFIKYIEYENQKIIRTGFPTLDAEIGGLFGGTFTGIGGVPKCGKTTLMLNMAREACIQGKKVLVVSLEMSENDIQAKLVSRITGIDTRHLRGIAHKNDETAMRAIMNASAEIAEYNLYRIGRKGVSVADIDGEIDNLGGVDIVFIDYLQKLTPTNRKEAKYNQVTQLSNDCSMLALKYNIPIVFIASINRQHVGRNDGKPTINDFRDSGVIEYDVTAALLLYKNEDEGMTELNIAANRFGPSNHVMRLKFMPEKSMFGELDLQTTTPRRDVNGE